MLALAPLSGLQAALKRRNSKVCRESIPAAQSSLTLPAIRRFSSTENLSPDHIVNVTRQISQRRIRKNSSGTNALDTIDSSCMELDMRIAKIKRKLAEFREEDVEILERVQELASSLSSLCQDYHIQVNCLPDLPTHQYTSYHGYYHQSSSPAEIPSRGGGSSNTDTESDDEEEFRKYCQNHTNLIRTTPVIQVQEYTTLPATKPTHIQLQNAHDGDRERWSTLAVPSQGAHLSHLHMGFNLRPIQDKEFLQPNIKPQPHHDVKLQSHHNKNNFEEHWMERSCP